MKKYLITLIALCLSAPSFADNFKQRINMAQKVSLTQAGQQYDKNLIPYIKTALHTCIPNGKPTSEDKSLILVGDVSSYGILQNVEARPQSKLAQCMIQNFGMPNLPVPPTDGKNNKGYPIVISITLKK